MAPAGKPLGGGNTGEEQRQVALLSFTHTSLDQFPCSSKARLPALPGPRRMDALWSAGSWVAGLDRPAVGKSLPIAYWW